MPNFDDQNSDELFPAHGPFAGRKDDDEDEEEEESEDDESASDDEEEEEEEEEDDDSHKSSAKGGKQAPAADEEDEEEEAGDEDDEEEAATPAKKAAADDDDDDFDKDGPETVVEGGGGLWDAFELDPGVIKSREEFENVSEESVEEDDGSWDLLAYDKAAKEFFGDHEFFGETSHDQYLDEGYVVWKNNDAMVKEADRLEGVTASTIGFYEKDGKWYCLGYQNAVGIESLKKRWPEVVFTEMHVTVPPQSNESYQAGKLPDALKKIPKADTVDLRTYCPPIANQGQTSRCSAFAWTHLMEIGARIKKQPLPPLSPNFTMMKFLRFAGNCKDYAYTYSGGSGSPRTPELGNLLLKEGTCREELWEPDAKKPSVGDQVMINDAFDRRLKNVTTVVVTLDNIKQYLSAGCPVHLIMNTGPEFAKTGRDGIIKAAEKPEGRHGCHAMIIVGYLGNYFIVKNSWGEGWGDKGYCYIPKAVLAKANTVLTALVVHPT